MICSDAEENVICTARPFAGQGVSLYVAINGQLRYRDQRLDCGQSLGAVASVTKTARVAYSTSPVSSLSISTTGFTSQTVAIEIRTFQDDVENESISPQTLVINSGGSSTPDILGTATLLNCEQRDGGVVRIRFIWEPSLIGLQPDTFTAIRTAGPSSPANVDYTAGSGRQLIEIDTPALSDVSAYTYKIRAASGATTKDILTGITVTADATGPAAPTVTAIEW